MDTKIYNRYGVYGYRDPDDPTQYYYLGQGVPDRPYDKHEPSVVAVRHKERFSPSVQKMIERNNIVPDHQYIEIIEKNMGKCEAQLLEQTLIKEHGINTNLFDQTDKGHTLVNSLPGEYPDDVYMNLLGCPDRRELYNTLYEQKKTPNLDRHLRDEIWKMSPREYAKHKSNKQYRDEALKYQTWAKQSLNSDNTEYVKQVAILVDKGISLTDAIDQLKNKDNKKKRNKTKKKSNTNKKTLVELQKEHADLKKQMKLLRGNLSRNKYWTPAYRKLHCKLASLACKIQLAKKSHNNIFKKPKKKKNRKKIPNIELSPFNEVLTEYKEARKLLQKMKKTRKRLMGKYNSVTHKHENQDSDSVKLINIEISFQLLEVNELHSQLGVHRVRRMYPR